MLKFSFRHRNFKTFLIARAYNEITNTEVKFDTIFQWQNIPGKLIWISSGSNFVVGVNRQHAIYYRAGISQSSPTGTHWVRIGGSLAQIDTNGNNVWGVNRNNDAYSLTVGITTDSKY